jgi:hypothetical protein
MGAHFQLWLSIKILLVYSFTQKKANPQASKFYKTFACGPVYVKKKSDTSTSFEKWPNG